VPATNNSKKQFGAYYTDKSVAEFLVRWALQSPEDKVADPSFGGGVFLVAAAQQLETLGGTSKTIYGVELDGNVHAQVSLELHATHGLNPRQLLNLDFFAVTTKRLPGLDAVAGNPPFIRYQGFNGEARQRALQTVQKKGIHLNKLASSWAAFVIHSISFLKKGGRLAMVVPAELGHAKYAKPVLKFLLESFGTITLLSFKEALFPDINQDTLLLLAENKGGCASHFYLTDLKGARALATLSSLSSQKPFKNTSCIEGKTFLQNSYKLNFYQLPKRARDVGIGYVTGANNFFHISAESAKRWNIPHECLKPAVYRGSAFKGLTFTAKDWQLADTEDAGFLFYPDDNALKIEKYLEQGLSQNIHTAYKCRIRSPWYKVPHVYGADAFLTYMNGLRSQFVVNEAKCVAPNTLHLVRLEENSNLTATDLAVLWQTSLTALSVELEGHALGGGMLKLEPGEAKNILIPVLSKPIPKSLSNKLDKLLRAGKHHEANELADEEVLEHILGFSNSEIKSLRQGAKQLRERRYYKTRPTPTP
jgi:adenine-specific DNA-methyltransferase